MREMRREPKVPEERVPSGRMSRWLCKAYLKGTCTKKNGILRNACFTSRRMDADLGKSALMRIARLKNSPAKGLKKKVTKCSGHVEEERASPKNRATCFGCLLIKYMTIGLRISGYGAAEVYLTEELKHTETNPTCDSGMHVFTSRRMDADLGKSALMRIARLKNSPAKGLKKKGDKVQWPC